MRQMLSRSSVGTMYSTPERIMLRASLADILSLDKSIDHHAFLPIPTLKTE